MQAQSSKGKEQTKLAGVGDDCFKFMIISVMEIREKDIIVMEIKKYYDYVELLSLEGIFKSHFSQS